MDIVLFCFGVIGMTHIIVDSDMPLLIWFRKMVDKLLPENISKMIHCYQCTGFWCGLFCGWIMGLTGWHIFIAGCAGGSLAPVMAIFLNYLEAKIMSTAVTLKEKDEG